MEKVNNTQNNTQQGKNNSTGSAATSEVSGSELCSVLLDVYDSALARQSSEIPDEKQALVSAVLSSLLALSHSAKTTALQGENKNFVFMLGY